MQVLLVARASHFCVEFGMDRQLALLHPDEGWSTCPGGWESRGTDLCLDFALILLK